MDSLVMDEVRGIAKWCARKGIKGNKGDRLPPLVSVRAWKWIDGNQDQFRAMIQEYVELRKPEKKKATLVDRSLYRKQRADGKKYLIAMLMERDGMSKTAATKEAEKRLKIAEGKRVK